MDSRLCYGMPTTGLGTTISILSLLLDINIPIKLEIDSNYTGPAVELKKIFQIPDEKLIIVNTDQLNVDNTFIVRDLSKIFSPYFNADSIKLFDKTFDIKSSRKKCVGITMSHNSFVGDVHDQMITSQRSWPYNRYYTRNEYHEIFDKIVSLGYDIITLNSRTTVEEKVFILNELCDFVIGYEGGIGHLAHLLKVPCFILPWRYNLDGKDLPPESCHIHALHIDPRTYFLENIEQFTTMHQNDLLKLVESLKEGQGGNNILLNNHCTINPSDFYIKIKHNLGFPTYQHLTSFEQNLLRQYLPDPRIKFV